MLPAATRSAIGMALFLAKIQLLKFVSAGQVDLCSAGEVACLEASLSRFGKTNWKSLVGPRILSALCKSRQLKARETLETRHLAQARSAARQMAAGGDETAGQHTVAADAAAAALIAEEELKQSGSRHTMPKQNAMAKSLKKQQKQPRQQQHLRQHLPAVASESRSHDLALRNPICPGEHHLGALHRSMPGRYWCCCQRSSRPRHMHGLRPKKGVAFTA